MGNQSGFMKRQQQIQNNIMHAAENLSKQFMVDTLQIALHKEFGWGYERQLALMEAWAKAREEYRPAVNPKDPEADVAQEHMDAALADLINGRQDLIPFAERYPELNKIRY